MKVGDSSVYDMDKLYARLLLISLTRDIKLSEVFQLELILVPSALFDEYGDMRKGNKATIHHKLAVFVTGKFRSNQHASNMPIFKCLSGEQLIRILLL